MTDCPNKKRNMSYCNCTYSCTRHGLCCECLHYHRQMGELPGCYFSKKAEMSYDRSVERYLEDKGK
jgi:hypothetical protein